MSQVHNLLDHFQKEDCSSRGSLWKAPPQPAWAAGVLLTAAEPGGGRGANHDPSVPHPPLIACGTSCDGISHGNGTSPMSLFFQLSCTIWDTS